MVEIFPSLISADLLALREVILSLEPEVAGFHLDVMDFHFVPNLTWGPAFINQIRLATKKQLWVHLMVDYPETYFDRLMLNPGDIVTIHIESPSNHSLNYLSAALTDRGWTPSVALNPTTPLEALNGLTFNHVLLMSVEPGFSGQPFIPDIVGKLRTLSNRRAQTGIPQTIALDGGINKDNVKELIHNGADQLALATAIFSDFNPAAAIKKILENC
jgi:ribulose-phosphate 3-epimerase